jgi:spermidine/putrescine-binding protein
MRSGAMLALAAILVGGWPASAACADEQRVAGTWTGSIATDQGDAGDVELVLSANA